jgi:hypothetical protein
MTAEQKWQNFRSAIEAVIKIDGPNATITAGTLMQMMDTQDGKL